MEPSGSLWNLMEAHSTKNIYEPNGSYQKPKEFCRACSCFLRSFSVPRKALQNPGDPQRNLFLENLGELWRTLANLSEPSETFRISANFSELLGVMQNLRDQERTFRAIEQLNNFREPTTISQNLRQPDEITLEKIREL